MSAPFEADYEYENIHEGIPGYFHAPLLGKVGDKVIFYGFNPPEDPIQTKGPIPIYEVEILKIDRENKKVVCG
jgi:hypothetical protein